MQNSGKNSLDLIARPATIRLALKARKTSNDTRAILNHVLKTGEPYMPLIQLHWEVTNIKRFNILRKGLIQQVSC